MMRNRSGSAIHKKYLGVHEMRNLIILIAAFVASCAPPARYSPPPAAKATDFYREVDGSFDTVWSRVTNVAGATFFNIKNFDKGSGLMTLDYSNLRSWRITGRYRPGCTAIFGPQLYEFQKNCTQWNWEYNNSFAWTKADRRSDEQLVHFNSLLSRRRRQAATARAMEIHDAGTGYSAGQCEFFANPSHVHALL
jgi:hypothetical protein